MNEQVITKEISKKIQGIAVLMMIIHHAFGFPERLLPGNSYIGIPIGGGYLETFVGSMCKICVSLFAFGTGYGLSYKTVNLKYIKQKAWNLLCIYWSSLVIFIVCGLIDGETYSLTEILKNIFLIDTSINHAAWYLPLYFLILFSIPLFQKLNPTLFKLIIFCLLCWGINYCSIEVWTPISNYFIYMPVVVCGIVCARSKVIKNIMDWFETKKILGLFLALLLLTLILGTRHVTGAEWKGFRFIWIYSPVIYMMMYILINSVSNVKFCDWIMSFLGKYSTEFWLTNAIFSNGCHWTQWLGYLPQISILVLIWQIIILTFVAKFFEFIKKDVVNTQKIT